MINFSGLQFIFRFFPVFFIVYYLTPAKYRTVVMTLGSLLFYASGDARFLPLIIIEMLVNWIFMEESARGKRSWVVSIAALDVAVLIGFKLLAGRYGAGLLPIGISFYTFRMISVQADLYAGKVKERPPFWDGMSYMCMFPQLVSGPITRYADQALPDAADPEGFRERAALALNRLEQGLAWFIPGLAMKILIADHLAVAWNDIGTIGYESISVPLAWLGVLVYSLELYFDFWGYSLMAAGIGVALGYPFVRNFLHPYAATGAADFYRRWHITLGEWFRDYVYIPLGGSRAGKLRHVVNLLAVWLLTALWHGISVNFIIWGMLLFVMILSERYLLPGLGALQGLFGRIHVLFVIPLTWIVFAITDTGYLKDYFCRLFGLQPGIAVYAGDLARVGTASLPYLVAGLALLIPGITDWYKHNRRKIWMKLIMVGLFWLSVYSAAGQAGNPFMYSRF